MAKPCFYYPDLIGNTEVGSRYELSASESAHALQSRRLTVGSQIQLIDGVGSLVEATIVETGRRVVSVQLDSISELSRAKSLIHCFIAMPKGDRQKVMVDMLTQLGVFEIIPLLCERSVSKFSDSACKKWQRVAVEACKQSQNPWVPKIASQIPLLELLGSRKTGLVLADSEGASPDEVLSSFSSITLLIGPEGGFSKHEFSQINQIEIPSLRVSSHILRTETAAVAAVSALLP